MTQRNQEKNSNGKISLFQEERITKGRMEKMSWTEHISYEEVLKLEEERSLLTTIRTRQRNWMEHIMRGDSLQGEIIEGRMEGKREWGRPRKKLLDWMMS